MMTNTPWLVHYPSDVPKQLQPAQVPHLPALIREAVITFGRRIAFTQIMPNSMNGSLGYEQLDPLSD
ncbi:MAG: hypothetical protein RI917_178 [Actinomycetota bacterium]